MSLPNKSITLICACKNRNQPLQIALTSWLLRPEITEIVLVDWDSDEALSSLTKLDYRIKVIRVQNQKYFNLPQPLNLAASIATGDYILKVDCDYIFNPYYNFFETYQIDETNFVSGKHDIKNYEVFDGEKYVVDKDNMSFFEIREYFNSCSHYFRPLNGLLFVSRHNFIKIGGYNDNIGKYYGYEDDEILHRFRVLGLQEKKLNYDYHLFHIPHQDKKRIENYEGYDSRQVEDIKNTLYGDENTKQWDSEYILTMKHIEHNKKISTLTDEYYVRPQTQWNIQQIDEQNYCANQIMNNKLENFPSVYYVSLEECKDRQDNIERQFAEYGITPTAILSKRFAESNDVVTGKYAYTLNEGTKGCVVSHLRAIKNWYENTDEDYGFFCEDDLSLETIQYWNFTWEEFIKKIPLDAECVQLLTIRGDFETFELRERQWNDWGATAYIITRDYVKMLINTYIRNDTYHLEVPNSEVMPLIENILFSGKTYTAPLFVENIEFNSTFVGSDDDVNDGQKRDHYYAHETVLNYWKGNLQEKKIPKSKSFTVKSRKPKSKIVDYFPYFNEKEILEFRINLLKDYVDKFVIVDANKSFTGKEKPFTCKNALKELGLWDENKIQVIELDLHSDDEVIFTDHDRYFNHNDHKKMIVGSRERMQRDALLSIVDQFDYDTVFIMSDCDEIINPEHLTYVPNIIRSNPNNIFKIPLVYCEGRADLRLFYESNNNPVQWDCSMFLATKNQLKTHTPNEIRSNFNISYPISYIGQYDKYGNFVRYEDMGWHFSWMGDTERKKLKSLSYSHYGHEFDHIVYKKCSGKLMEEFIENHKVEEGNIGVSGQIGTVMKKYPQESLPQIIFDLPRVKEFLLPSPSTKNELEELLTTYSLDTENPEHNFNLGVWYENQGHTAPALSYFLRSAERAADSDSTLAYESLIRGSYCYFKQGTRDESGRGMLWQAQMVLPNRPEAYFLLARYAAKKEWWQDCYTSCELGLLHCDFNLLPLKTDVEYPGKCGFLFQKAISGWWWGKVEESRSLLVEILNNYEISESNKETIINNLKKMGVDDIDNNIRVENVNL